MCAFFRFATVLAVLVVFAVAAFFLHAELEPLYWALILLKLQIFISALRWRGQELCLLAIVTLVAFGVVLNNLITAGWNVYSLVFFVALFFVLFVSLCKRQINDDAERRRRSKSPIWKYAERVLGNEDEGGKHLPSGSEKPRGCSPHPYIKKGGHYMKKLEEGSIVEVDDSPGRRRRDRYRDRIGHRRRATSEYNIRRDRSPRSGRHPFPTGEHSSRRGRERFPTGERATRNAHDESAGSEEARKEKRQDLYPQSEEAEKEIRQDLYRLSEEATAEECPERPRDEEATEEIGRDMGEIAAGTSSRRGSYEGRADSEDVESVIGLLRKRWVEDGSRSLRKNLKVFLKTGVLPSSKEAVTPPRQSSSSQEQVGEASTSATQVDQAPTSATQVEDQAPTSSATQTDNAPKSSATQTDLSPTSSATETDNSPTSSVDEAPTSATQETVQAEVHQPNIDTAEGLQRFMLLMQGWNPGNLEAAVAGIMQSQVQQENLPIPPVPTQQQQTQVPMCKVCNQNPATMPQHKQQQQAQFGEIPIQAPAMFKHQLPQKQGPFFDFGIPHQPPPMFMQQVPFGEFPIHNRGQHMQQQQVPFGEFPIHNRGQHMQQQQQAQYDECLVHNRGQHMQQQAQYDDIQTVEPSEPMGTQQQGQIGCTVQTQTPRVRSVESRRRTRSMTMTLRQTVSEDEDLAHREEPLEYNTNSYPHSDAEELDDCKTIKRRGRQAKKKTSSTTSLPSSSDESEEEEVRVAPPRRRTRSEKQKVTFRRDVRVHLEKSDVTQATMATYSCDGEDANRKKKAKEDPRVVPEATASTSGEGEETKRKRRTKEDVKGILAKSKVPEASTSGAEEAKRRRKAEAKAAAEVRPRRKASKPERLDW